MHVYTGVNSSDWIETNDSIVRIEEGGFGGRIERTVSSTELSRTDQNRHRQKSE